MDTSKRRFIRLAIVTATAAGVALASPVVAVADESEVIEAAPIGENSDPPVVTIPPTEPLVIELIVKGDPLTDSTDPPEGAESEQLAEAEAIPTATDSEPVVTDPNPMFSALQATSAEQHADEPGGEHSGNGGTGDPYRITFEVSWRLPNDSVIAALEVPTDLRTIFDLAAASATGGGKPTSAHCTYPPEGTDLVCEFENPGKHSSVTDGLIVPGKKSATYSVTVLPITGWEINGANAGPYSARDLDSCPPRGGGGHDSGHDSGHGETVEVAALEETGSVCLHTVVMRQSPVSPEPPPVQDPPVSEVPAEAPPQSQAPPEATPTPPAVEALPVTVTPKALPATGNTATTTLMIGTVILALGGCLYMLARRRNDLPLS